MCSVGRAEPRGLTVQATFVHLVVDPEAPRPNLLPSASPAAKG